MRTAERLFGSSSTASSSPGLRCDAASALGAHRRRARAAAAAAMLQQPRVPPTGQRQAVEVHIKWREVLDYKRELLRCLSIATGWGVDKLDTDMQRPLYMRPLVRCRRGVVALSARA